jgi:hypothetical protein
MVTCHDVTIDVFDDKVANILDRCIAATFLQCPDLARRIIRWFCEFGGK